MRNSLHISVIGAGRATAELYAVAEEVGRLVAQAGAVLVCGGLSGVMAAAARGAQEAGGHTVGILPGHDRSEANLYVDCVIATGMGHGRNLAVVSTGDVVIAVGGAYGTLSEIGLARAIGRPVVLLDSWRLQHDEGIDGVFYATTPQQAITLALDALGIPPA